MATPSLAMIPSAIADAKVYSVLPNNGDGDFTFDRASTATRVGQNGLIETVAIDQPRLNYDISNGVVQSCPSLLLEPASTNLITYSEAFDNAYWTKSGSSVASGFTSPSGDLSAFKFAEDGTNSYHYCRRLTVAVASASIVTLSLFAKKSENSYVALFEGRSGGTVFFNLETKTVVSASGGASGTIEQLPNDWCKIALTVTVPSTIANFEIYNSNDGTSLTYQGVSGNGVYIWGAQLEQLSYATSYIPNSGQSAGVTRAAESCFGAGTSSTFNSTEGVLYAEISALANDLSTRKISLSDGTSSNAIYIGYITTTNKIRGYINVANGGGQVVDFTLSDITAFSKFAVRWLSNGNATFWANGSNVGSMTAGAGFSSSTLSQLQFTREQGGTAESFFGNTKDIRVYNEALTDAQLQTLTTL